MPAITAIRIADSFILESVAREQERRGDSTPTKTAMRLISERLAQLEVLRSRTGNGEPQLVKLVPQE